MGLLWSWPTVSSCVCSVPSWGPITILHISTWPSATEGKQFVAPGNSRTLPLPPVTEACSKRFLVLVLKEGICFPSQTLST